MHRVPHRRFERARDGASRALCVVFLLVIAATVGCASSGPRVTRTDAAETIDVSGFWNDSDSQQVAAEMVQESLSQAWIDVWREEKGERPSVIVGAVRNRSSEHINTRPFAKELERAFVNSGRVRVVASSDERDGIREERLDQLRNSTLESAKSMGKEIGADLMLIGGINTIVDAAGGRSVRYYQVELELVALETNEKVWIGQHKIKKVVDQSRYRP